jgi:type III pantothenate kinase
MKLLCLDFGNTRVKWGLREDEAWCGQGAMTLAQLDTLETAADAVVACNVAGPAAQATGESLARRLGTSVRWVRSSAECCGVRNGYARPEQLGADRWSALIGARAVHGGACLVVTSGTATTIDVLDDIGLFRGGLIVPGLDLMRMALAGGTADLPADAGEYCDPPLNTLDAIASGAVQATLGAIERMYRHVATMRNACCLLSGGASEKLEPHLALPKRRVDNLVLEGLARIAREAEPA